MKKILIFLFLFGGIIYGQDEVMDGSKKTIHGDLHVDGNLTVDGSAPGGGGSDGWHGSTTRIKLGAIDLCAANNDQDWKPFIINDGGYIHDPAFKLAEYVSFPISIPTGYKATAYRIYASASVNVEIFEGNIDTGTTTSRGSGNSTAEVNMTDVSSTTTNYLSIVIADDTQQIFGGYVTIEAL